MPMDAVCLGAITKEINEGVSGARIEKIQQPTRDTVVLLLSRSRRLLINAGANQPRIQLTEILRENPAQPPMFCMLLRKHLSGGKLSQIKQPGLERVVEIDIDITDEMGEPGRRTLVLEAMGRRSNLILLDGDGRIVDCLRRVDMDMSEKRQIMPGMFYRLPPAQEGKKNPLDISKDDFAALAAAADPEQSADKFLLASFYGIAPLLCREIAFEAFGATDVKIGEIDRDRLWSAFSKYMQCISSGTFSPTMLSKGDKPFDFYAFGIGQYENAAESVSCNNMSEMLDGFYEKREKSERMHALGQDLQKTAANTRDRVKRKLAIQEKEYAVTQNRDELRRYGDLITANLYRLEKGINKAQVEDYYDENCPVVEIRLDPLLTPQQNAARYYKNYNKAKTAEKILGEQIEKGRAELDYLESVVEELREAENEQELREIRAEMTEAGYLSNHVSGKKQMHRAALSAREFVSPAGLLISVGRNNKQNDKLTLKDAYKSDMWFHTQKIHGSHTILHCEGNEPDEESMRFAAMLAAYYSKAREGQNVPVDYTHVRNVKKPHGAKPGMVIYDVYRTVYVTPDEELVKKLAKRK